MAMRRLVIATSNLGKLREFRELLATAGMELEGFEPGVAETGDSYSANAVLKAQAASRMTGEPALGDDSGLEIEALASFPGLHSARIAPSQEERIQIVLERLAGVAAPWRARYVCVLALVVPGRAPVTFSGTCVGEITEPRDNGQGFGYDPVFLLPDLGKTFGQLSASEKHRWSHRGAAIRALLESGALDELKAVPSQQSEE
jgi:XTP/dITP diphosphohydrolase